MKAEGAGFIPVVDGDGPIGVITDRDIVVRGLAEFGASCLGQPVERVMSTDVTTIGADADLEEAAELMNQQEIRRLPVMDGGRLVGILSHGNLVQATKGGKAAHEATVGVTRGA
jgi:CBS domain-containing protein